MGSSTAVVPPCWGADEAGTATSGNCCLKFASSSSPGFWELVLVRRGKTSATRIQMRPTPKFLGPNVGEKKAAGRCADRTESLQD
jgi:hypothetical protein